MRKRLIAFLVVAGVAVGVGLYYSLASEDPAETTDQVYCTRLSNNGRIFMANPTFNTSLPPENINGAPVDPPINNFIDRMIQEAADAAQVPLGTLADDEEFLRRVYLDTTGRQATVEQVTAFSQNPDRSQLIADLLETDDFKDRLTWFYGELLRLTNVFGNDRNNNIQVRNEYFQYVKDAAYTDKPWNVLMRELVTATGQNRQVPQVNYLVRVRRNLGDTRDVLDEMAIMTTRAFLGMSIECISCHNGAGHLGGINEYLLAKTRNDLWGMAAFFSSIKIDSTRMPVNPSQQMPEITATVLDDGPGTYDRNGGGGIRPGRCGSPCGPDIRYVKPKYLFDGTEVSDNYRENLANLIEGDEKFARALANYAWEWLMGVGIISPGYAFDPERPPFNLALLDALAEEFKRTGYNVKNLVSLILNSSTYQRSGYWRDARSWQDDWGKYNVRHFERRLEPEQLVDSIMQFTNANFTYNIPDLGTLNWANQFPDVIEPVNRSGNPAPNGIGSVLAPDKFDRGDRYGFIGGNKITARPYPAVGSIKQVLTVMNEKDFINPRLRAGSLPSYLTTTRAKDLLQKLNAGEITSDEAVKELYLAALNRQPTSEEMATAQARIDANPRNGIEDVGWALINSLAFLFY